MVVLGGKVTVKPGGHSGADFQEAKATLRTSMLAM